MGKFFGKQTLSRMIKRWRNNIKICWREITFENEMIFNYGVVQALKIQNRWEGREILL
jgi:hypothetical protein